VLQIREQVLVARHLVRRVGYHDEERRCVDRPVVGRVRDLLARRHLAQAELVHDLAGLLLREVVELRSLELRERSQGGRSELGVEHERLVGSQERVTPEGAAEPGDARGHRALAPQLE